MASSSARALSAARASVSIDGPRSRRYPSSTASRTCSTTATGARSRVEPPPTRRSATPREPTLEKRQSLLLRGSQAHLQHALGVAPEQSEHTVRRRIGSPFAPVEVVTELGGLLGLPARHLGHEQRAPVVETPHRRAGLRVLAHPLGHDVARSLKGVVHRGHARLRVDEGRRCLAGVEAIGRILSEQARGQRLQAALAGDGGPGAPLGAEGQIEVLERGHSGGRGKTVGQLLCEQRALLERAKDRLPPFLQLGQLGQPVAHRRDLHFIEGVRHLLAIARDEGDGRALGEELGHRGHLRGPQAEFAGQP